MPGPSKRSPKGRGALLRAGLGVVLLAATLLALVAWSPSSSRSALTGALTSVEDSAERAADALATARRTLGAGSDAVRRARSAAARAEEAARSVGGRLGDEGRARLDDARRELDVARTGLERQAKAAHGTTRKALERAIEELEDLSDRLRSASPER